MKKWQKQFYRFHKVFLVNWLEQVLILVVIVLGGVPKPFTPPEATPTGTACERYEFDLIEIKRKLDDSSGLKKVQGTFAWTAKLFDMKRSGCSRPSFVSSSTWNKVPT